MTEQELALIEKVKSEVALALKSADQTPAITELKESLKNVVSKADVDALVSKFATVEANADLLKKLEEVALQVKALGEAPKFVSAPTLKGALELAFAEKKNEIELASKGQQSAPIKLNVKVSTMSVDDTIGSGSTFNTITQNTGIISATRRRELTYLANVSVGSIGTNRAVWIEQTTSAGTPIMLGEGDAKTQLDSVWVEQTMGVKKIAVYGKVTTELMADIPQLISYIETDLMRRMDIVLESNLFSGAGTGDNLKGVITYASAFSGGSLAGTIVNANELDVIEAVAVQVKRGFGMPNALFVHPDTLAKIKLIKDNNGRPIWKDYVTTDGFLTLSGMKIIETTAVTAGTYVGGDMSVVKVLNRNEMGIQIGLDGNDFTNNVKTLLCEKRLVQFVSANDTQCLVTGTFATDIATLQIV